MSGPDGGSVEHVMVEAEATNARFVFYDGCVKYVCLWTDDLCLEVQRGARCSPLSVDEARAMIVKLDKLVQACCGAIPFEPVELGWTWEAQDPVWGMRCDFMFAADSNSRPLASAVAHYAPRDKAKSIDRVRVDVWPDAQWTAKLEYWQLDGRPSFLTPDVVNRVAQALFMICDTEGDADARAAMFGSTTTSK